MASELNYSMGIEFKTNDKVSPEEMQALAESVGLGPHRSLDRNKAALSGSFFIATARHQGQLVGLIRLISDGAYILHLGDLIVHQDFQNKGIGRKLMEIGLAFAKEKKIGTGDNLGEFTLFANTGTDRFYEKLKFGPVPNGMALIDTESRQNYERDFQKKWFETRKENK